MPRPTGTSRTCLRCGEFLPAGSSLSRRYCPECSKARNREQTRERAEKARKKAYIVYQERKETKDREYCKRCVFYGSESYGANLCDYILRTGHMRGCKPGEGCTKREERQWE